MRYFLIILLSFSMAGCSVLPDWMGGEEAKTPLPGKRISVLAHRSGLTADSANRFVDVELPPVVINTIWGAQDIAPAEHPALGKVLDKSASKSVGAAPEEAFRLTSTPLVVKNKVYTLDGEGVVRAHDSRDLNKLIWSAELGRDSAPGDLFGMGVFTAGSDRKSFLGGNIGYGDGRLFLSTARGKIAAIDAETGANLWERSVKVPIKSPPLAHQGLVYFITTNNSVYALNAETGKTVWTHAGARETTSILGSPSPVAKDDIVVVPYSSGEIHALNAITGTSLWSEMLSGTTQRYTTLLSLNDISATPVISGNNVFAVSHDGVLSMFDLFSGSRVWTQDISSVQTPWVAGRFLYILTMNQELVCIHIPDGSIKWVEELPAHADALIGWGGENKGDKITWSGPVLAGERLFLVGSHGRMIVASPKDGKLISVMNVPSGVMLPPIVANQTLYLLENDADLTALY